jgi:hypothetical protein
MNYFAHALHFLDRPYFAAGTAVPDWLMVADRRTRVRAKNAERMVGDPQPQTALVAGGILQHVRDDRRFHQGRAFVELSLALGTMARNARSGDGSMRPAFLGHLLVEVLLDASLVAEDPARLEAYYRALASVDALLVEQAVNRMVSRPTGLLAPLIRGFCREQILRDYLEDGRLFARLGQVMRRVKLAPLPEGFRKLLPEARRLVEDRRSELLEGIPAGGIPGGLG